jgi:nucleoside-diphosphate-sugar epimerase
MAEGSQSDRWQSGRSSSSAIEGWQSKRVLVTGSSGYVGRAVGKTLAEAGHVVVGLDLAEHPDSQLTDFCQLDLTDREATMSAIRTLTREFAGQLSVVHLAGLFPKLADRARVDENAFALANFEATRNLVNALNEVRSRGCFIHISTLAFLRRFIDTAPAPLDAYATTKLQAESYVSAKASCPWIVVRLARVMGMSAARSPVSTSAHGITAVDQLLVNVRKGVIPADIVADLLSRAKVADDEVHLFITCANMLRTYVWIDDVTRLLTAALEGCLPARRVYHAATFDPVSLREIAQIIEEEFAVIDGARIVSHCEETPRPSVIWANPEPEVTELLELSTSATVIRRAARQYLETCLAPAVA